MIIAGSDSFYFVLSDCLLGSGMNMQKFGLKNYYDEDVCIVPKINDP
jgi:hypothetical protein